MAIGKNEFRLKSREEARKEKIEIYSPKAFRASNQKSETDEPSSTKGGWFFWLSLLAILYVVFKYLM